MAGDRNLEHIPTGLSEPKARHKSRDLEFGAAVEVALGLILLATAWGLILVRLSPYFEIRASASQSRPTVAEISAAKLPPEPRLQNNAVEDLRQIQAAEDQVLTSYGWVDRKKGLVRIPIDRAIDLLAQRGLPGRAARRTQDNAGDRSIPAEPGVASKVH